MKLNKLFIYALVPLVLPFFTACSEDDDDNPTYKAPTSFVLNTPALAANNVYDLANSSTIELTCSQPDYGYPAWTEYSLDVGLQADLSDAVSLTSTYFQGAKLSVPAEEINEALKNLTETWAEFPTDPVALYVRAKASLRNSAGRDTLGTILSNIICLPKVLGYSQSATLTLPEGLYMTGSFVAAGGDWSKWLTLNPVYDDPSKFYAVVYFNAGDEFKISQKNAWNGTDFGPNGTGVTVTDDAGANVSASSDEAGANFKVGTAGWYTIVATCKINGKLYNYDVRILKPVVQLFGATTGDIWAWDSAWEFTAPATADGDWVSPAAAGSGEMRIAINCGVDWWKTEFTFYEGAPYYRNVNIPANWAENVGEKYSVTVNAGQKVHVNFTNNTGSLE